MIINMHAHIQVEESKGSVSVSGLGLGEYVGHCRKIGVEKACICDYHAKYNTQVRDAVNAYPDFFIGVGNPDPDRDAPDIVDTFHAWGFRGLKFIYTGRNYDDKAYFPFYERAASHKMFILFHTGYVASGGDGRSVSYERMQPVHLDAVSRAFPDLKLIGAHLGNTGFCLQAAEVAAKVPGVYFDLSGGTVRWMPYSLLKILFCKSAEINLRTTDEVTNMELFKKIVFGSDSPLPEVLIEFYDNLFNAFNVDEETRKDVMYRNAQKIIGL
ncbi:MAG: amidohydrolase family protein [Victivallaceae bacterium]